jgi:hypothetical protein
MIEISDEIIEAMNDEILLMRKELWSAHENELMLKYESVDVHRALHYFLAIPFLKRKGRYSRDILEECCKVSHNHRTEK